MRVGLSAFDCLPGQYGGIEIYFRDLLQHLDRADDGNSYLALCNRSLAGTLPPTSGSVRVKIFDFRRFSLNWLARNLIKRTARVDIVNQLIDGMQLDVVHHPFTTLNPQGLKVPSVLTFHDMQQEFFPEFFKTEVLDWRKSAYRASTAQATRIIAISEYTKRCLVERYGVDDAKIDVVYQGYNPRYRVLQDAAAEQVVRGKYGLERPFLLYPAVGWPHKNHQRLFEAVALLKQRRGFDGRLVLTGISRGTRETIAQQAEAAGVADSVQILGYLAFEELPVLYRMARLTVFPSLFEGFGIPVACSDVTSLPEVAGEAGALFDPYSVEDMAEKVWSVWATDSRRQELAAAGLQRVKLFNWEDFQTKTVDVYRKAASA
jgi:glycosyltransferase involved in cell wall biosynthesis